MSNAFTSKGSIKISLTLVIAFVWFANGFFCKILNWVPRHQMIVARILGENYAVAATKTIGALELLMVGWILSGFRSKLCAWAQIAVVITMYILESVLAPDLLLLGRANAFPMAFFISIVYLNGFIIPSRINRQLA